MDDLKERLRANALDECDEAIAYIEELEQDVKAVQRREADANRAAMKHLRNLELERIKSANYAEFSNQWRKKCEALEARIAKADALSEAAWLFMESHCVDQDSGEMADRERLENAATAYREGSDT
jgi:hypothetical protein